MHSEARQPARLILRDTKARIRTALRAEERSQAWLARKLNMSETLLAHYIAGRRPAPADLIDRIAAVLGVPADTLRPRDEMVAA